MKLLLCTSCHDVRKLGRDVTSCRCGEVKARYLEDGWHAEHNGRGHLIGIDNQALAYQLHQIDRVRSAEGRHARVTNPRIEAWLMTDNERVTINEQLGADGFDGAGRPDEGAVPDRGSIPRASTSHHPAPVIDALVTGVES